MVRDDVQNWASWHSYIWITSDIIMKHNKNLQKISSNLSTTWKANNLASLHPCMSPLFFHMSEICHAQRLTHIEIKRRSIRKDCLLRRAVTWGQEQRWIIRSFHLEILFTFNQIHLKCAHKSSPSYRQFALITTSRRSVVNYFKSYSLGYFSMCVSLWAWHI